MKKIIAISLIAVGLIAYNSLFIVEQTEQAIVLEFRKPVEIITEPGLKFMMPWQTVSLFDKRVLDYHSPNVNTFIAGDQKRLEVDAFLKYKISDPLKFLQAVQDERNLIRKLDPVMESSLRRIISEVPLHTLLTERRAELMDKIKQQVNEKAANFGIEIIDVRIMRADFPEKNRGDIYQRMISEREREAKDLRAKGAEEATIIRANADKERTILIAEAEKTAQILRGEGDGKATKIFATAFGRDPEFFDFYRSMEAYKQALKKEDTTLILSPDNKFLKFFDKK